MVKMVMMVLCVVVTCMVAAAPYTEAITCGQVASNLAPCNGYLKYGGFVPPACCIAVKALNNTANTTPDRQMVCHCFKIASSGYDSHVNPTNAATLPGKCLVNLPFVIGPTTNCTKVH